MKQYDMTLLGGDARIAYMAPYLLEKGYRVICYGIEDILEEDENGLIYAKDWQEAVEQSDCIIGGIPLFKDGNVFSKQDVPELKANDLYKCLEEEQTLFGGVIPKNFADLCKEKEIRYYDFMSDEPLAIFNAVATAEGIILEALKHQKTNIQGSKSLVLGYGRCGKVLAEKLKGMGAEVTVCSRCEIELAYADVFGLKTFPLHALKEKIHEYEYIYNTIPVVLIGKHVLTQMRRDALILDIASGLGGVDYASAKETGIAAYHCSGLPGKYAPKTSAERLADFVIHKLKQ